MGMNEFLRLGERCSDGRGFGIVPWLTIFVLVSFQYLKTVIGSNISFKVSQVTLKKVGPFYAHSF